MVIVCFIALILTLLYYYGTHTFDYWSKRGIKHPKPLPFLGTNTKQFFQKASIAMLATETCKMFPNEKVVGFYRGLRPELFIRDPEIIKRILITDFNKFYPRGINLHKTEIEPMLKNLFFADGDVWKLLRQKISPAFSTGKIKAMFKLITDRAEKLQKSVEETIKVTETIDAREMMARYTTDFIGACGFGIEMDTLNENNSQFRALGKRIFYRNYYDAFRGGLKLIFPEIMKKVHFLAPEIEKTMMYLITDVCNKRNYKPNGSNDFIDLMLEVREKRILKGESIEHKNPDGSTKQVEIEFDDLLMAAQVFVFFGAGFETSSSSSSFTLHQLAYHPDIQKKVQDEIDLVLAQYDNVITYDAVKDMKYLEMCFSESLRMFPPVAFLWRQCAVPEYRIPELDITITEGIQVLIPIQEIHNDERNFKDPEKFDPQRFSPENQDYKKHVYLPFGAGPRACVGERLGIMQSMAGIIAILQKFTVEPSEKSRQVPIFDPAAIVAESFIGGLPLVFKKRS